MEDSGGGAKGGDDAGQSEDRNRLTSRTNSGGYGNSFPSRCGTCPMGHCTEIEGRVVAERRATSGHLPWQVRLHRVRDNLCGGTIITERWIVSAAHCMLEQ